MLFCGILWTQLACFTGVVHNFNVNFPDLSAIGLPIFLFSWYLSDLAAVLCLCELAIATHGKVFSVKFEEDPSKRRNYSNLRNYGPLLFPKPV